MNLIYNNITLTTNVRHGKSMHQNIFHSGIWIWGASPCVARIPAFLSLVPTFPINGYMLCRSLACGYIASPHLYFMFYSHIINVPFLIICSKHVVFRRVVEGIYVMNKIELLSTADRGRTIVPIKISNCGEIFPGKYNDIVEVDEGTFIF